MDWAQYVYLLLYIDWCVVHVCESPPCVCCRSEANDLSLHIAKEVTGGSVVIALRK